MIQEGYVILVHQRPVVEAELATTYLTGIFAGGGQGLVKTARMRVRPVPLSAEDALILGEAEGLSVFQMEYVFHDAKGLPIASGSFIFPDGTFALTASLGMPLAPRAPQ